jgi:hypothetical protein
VRPTAALCTIVGQLHAPSSDKPTGVARSS